MKLIKYSEDWFEVGPGGHSERVFAAGQLYPVTEKSKGHVIRGIAEEVDAPADAEKAEAAADKLEAKADDSAAAATAAREAADAAAAAKAITDAAEANKPA